MEYFLERRCTKIIIITQQRSTGNNNRTRTFSPCWWSSLILLPSFGMCSLFLVLCGQGAANLSIAKDNASSHAPSPVGWFTWMFPAFAVSYVVNDNVGGHWIRVTKKKIIITYNYFSFSPLPTPFRCDGTKLDSVPCTNGHVAPLLDCCLK